MKINNLKLKTILLLVACCLLLISAPPASAASLGLSIDPPIITINAIPPTTVTSPISIQNKGDAQVTLQIQLKPFKAKGENGELEYSREALQIIQNIQILDAGVPVESITLDPQQQKSLSLTISVPPDTNISDYYFSVVFVSTNFSPIESSSSINQIGIAANVLLSVGPLETPKANLEEFSSGILFEKGPVPFTIRVNNTGTHFIKPTGGIAISNMFGQTIGKFDLTSINILSDSIRAIPNSNYLQELRLKDDAGAKTSYSDFGRPIALWKESFLLGLYTATLNISLSADGPTFTKTIHFFAFPLQGILAIVIVIIAIIIFRKRIKLYLTHR